MYIVVDDMYMSSSPSPRAPGRRVLWHDRSSMDLPPSSSATRSWIILLAALVAGATACGGDDDSPVIDGPAAIDAAVDARVIDAPAIPPAVVDACDRICRHIFNDCQEIAVPPACISGCQQDLLDCNSDQLAEVRQCAALSCPIDETPVVQCMNSIACVQG